MSDRFCNYCPCSDCRTGRCSRTDVLLKHAKTFRGDWICDICHFELERKGEAPVLVTGWEEQK